jgi:hypothetical protein
MGINFMKATIDECFNQGRGFRGSTQKTGLLFYFIYFLIILNKESIN